MQQFHSFIAYVECFSLEQRPWSLIAPLRAYFQKSKVVRRQSILDLVSSHTIEQVTTASPLRRMYITLPSAEFMILIIPHLSATEPNSFIDTCIKTWSDAHKSIKPEVLGCAVYSRIDKLLTFLNYCQYSFFMCAFADLVM